MVFGPGKYDALATLVRQATGGSVILLVINGAVGDGFSAQIYPELLPAIPQLLRSMADDIEANPDAGG